METDRFTILARILQSAAGVAPDGWREMIINFYLGDGHSAQVNTCLVGNPAEEVPLPFDQEQDALMRELCGHMVQAGEPAFTRCWIHLTAEGDYEAKYFYDPVDWDSMWQSDWNFFPKNKH